MAYYAFISELSCNRGLIFASNPSEAEEKYHAMSWGFDDDDMRSFDNIFQIDVPDGTRDSDTARLIYDTCRAKLPLAGSFAVQAVYLV